MAQATLTLRKLAAGAATVAFGITTAHAAPDLINNPAISNRYRADFLVQTSTTIKDPEVGGAARGFIVDMEAALKAPTDKTKVVVYPNPQYLNLLSFVAVTPPKGMESADIPVCAEKDNKVLGLWTISSQGQVKPITNWAGPMASEGKTPACKAFIQAARASMLAAAPAEGQPQAGATPAQPPPVAVAALR